MAIKPLADRVLIQQVEAEEKTSGGIYIPDNAKEKPSMGKVVAVGAGKTENGQLVAPEVAKGDIVFYGKYAGTEIVDGDDAYIIMRESDILAVQK